MGLLDILLDQSNEGAIGQIGQQFGLDSKATRDVLGQLAPALSGGLRRNAAETSGRKALAGALSAGHHANYLDDVSRLGQPQTVEDGNAILGHLFGSKAVSRGVAARAAEQTSVDSGTIQKILPVVATLIMGALSKQTRAGQGLLDGDSAGGDLLTSLLDSDGDGSIADDLLGLAKKFL